MAGTMNDRMFTFSKSPPFYAYLTNCCSCNSQCLLWHVSLDFKQGVLVRGTPSTPKHSFTHLRSRSDLGAPPSAPSSWLPAAAHTAILPQPELWQP